MRLFVAAIFVAPLLSFAAGAQQSAPIPNEVRRRIAQAMWPENLFDSTGAPERGFVRRPFQPAFSDLRVRRTSSSSTLPGVTLYVGAAYPSACVHCGTRTYAVAQRGAAFVTLLSASDIEFLSPWVGPGVLTDSIRLRSFVIDALRGTCFLSCELKQVRRRAEIPQADSPFLRSADERHHGWKLPPTYSWQRNGGVVVDFPLLAVGVGVYAAHAEADGSGFLHVSVSPVARYVF